MTTTGYEVHVIKDRRWIVAERFANDAKDEAIAAAKRMFNVDRVDGVRVFTEKFDNATQLFVPQYVMRDVRQGVKVARDAPVQAPAAPPVRRVASAPRAVAAQASSGAGWRPALASGPNAAFAGPSGSIGVPGGFNPDQYLQTIEAGGDPSLAGSSAEQVSVLREAGKRAFETAVLIAGLLMEGIGFAMLLALLDGTNATWSERPLWVGLAFGLLLGGLLVVVRQIRKLRALGSWFTKSNDALEAYPTPRSLREPRGSSFRWRPLFDAVFYGKMPSKWPEPEPDRAPVAAAASAPKPVEQEVVSEMATEQAEQPAAQAPAASEPDAAPIDKLTGFITKYLHGPAFQEIADSLQDEDSRFAAYLYLRGAADACVSAAGGAARAQGLVLTAALDPLQLSSALTEDFALRSQLFQQDPRYLATIDRGREAMAAGLQRRQTDGAAFAAAIAEWRERPPLSESERLYLLTIEAELSMGGVPPEPSVVAHAFDDHKAMVEVVVDIYRGKALGGQGCMSFRAAPDAAAAAMEIQARRLELSMADDAVPLDVRTVATEHPLVQFETGSVTAILTDARGLAAQATPGDVLVSESMRPALTGVGYKLRETRTISILGREPVQLAAIEWEGAPQISPAPAGAPLGAAAVAPAASPAATPAPATAV